jgi:hypothetical protein
MAISHKLQCLPPHYFWSVETKKRDRLQQMLIHFIYNFLHSFEHYTKKIIVVANENISRPMIWNFPPFLAPTALFSARCFCFPDELQPS